MKTILIPLILLIVLHTTIYAQHATDFTCNDCDGNSFHLFEEVSDNHVMVICWVMPCSACIGPAKTAYSVYRSFQESNPGVVKMILADDYADSYCSSIQSWATTNRLDNIPVFVNQSIDMQDYGADGMPKIVVIAGNDKKVYFEGNNFINGDSMYNAIQLAITDLGLSIESHSGNEFAFISTNDELKIQCKTTVSGIAEMRILDIQGRIIEHQKFSEIAQGESVSMKISHLPKGMYIFYFESNVRNYTSKILID